MADQICPETEKSNIHTRRARFMSDPLDDRELALRRELSKRTISMPSRTPRDEQMDTDPEHIKSLGCEICNLIKEERLEEARERLDKAIQDYPDEPGLLNLEFALSMMLKPFGSYDKAKETTGKAIELAVGRDNSYFVRVALNNMALVAQKEGHEEFSKAMYLAAHYIDNKAIPPMANIAGWYSRKGELENSQSWIDKLLDLYPDWHENEEITTFLEKDEMLRNLRTHEPFKKKVLSKIERKK
jgi:tetratricopeptide (TPR) repeat protein